MTVPDLLSRRYLVIDNNVLSNLCSFFCEHHAPKLRGANRYDALKRWIARQLDTLCQSACDKSLHCTSRVADEFRPSGMLFAQLRPNQLDAYRSFVRSQLKVTVVDMQDVSFLRNMPNANRSLVNRATGISDEDFSLVLLGIELAAQGDPVYVITDDQSLLDYISWVRTQSTARQRWAGMSLLQGIRDMTYFDILHRGCTITTEEMQNMLNFLIKSTMTRAIEGQDQSSRRSSRPRLMPKKAMHILQQYQQIQTSLTRSAQIKARAKGVTQ